MAVQRGPPRAAAATARGSPAPPSSELSKVYGEYYDAHYQGGAYERGSPEWTAFFGSLSDRIVRDVAPQTMLDAGCAKGFLVEALRDHGVEAFGIDISEYAIASVREDIRGYCSVGSLTDELPRNYDLIVCLEVLEHLPEEEAERAGANLCRHTDDIIFSSTPDDFTEASPLNVRPPEWWAEQFARNDFYRDIDYDARYIAPWALRLRRRRDPVPRVVGSFERLLTRAMAETRERNALIVQQAGAFERRPAEVARRAPR